MRERLKILFWGYLFIRVDYRGQFKKTLEIGAVNYHKQKELENDSP